MATADQLLKAEEREQARLDMFVESIEQGALEDIDDLLHHEERRDPEIFALVGADPEVTIDEYEEVPVSERDFNWVAGVSAMAVAARLQVFASHRERVIGLFSARARNVNGLSLDREDLLRAAKTGISKAGIKAARAELAAPPEDIE